MIEFIRDNFGEFIVPLITLMFCFLRRIINGLIKKSERGFEISAIIVIIVVLGNFGFSLYNYLKDKEVFTFVMLIISSCLLFALSVYLFIKKRWKSKKKKDEFTKLSAVIMVLGFVISAIPFIKNVILYDYFIGENNNYKISDYTLVEYTGKESTFVIPDNVQIIKKDAFKGHSELTKIEIPKDIKTIEEGSFVDCNLEYYIDDNALYLGNNANNYLALVKASNKDIVACKINENTRIICDGAFRSCAKLTSIEIPDSVKFIGDNSFYDCTSLQNLVLPVFIEGIGNNAFKNCSDINYYRGPEIGYNKVINQNGKSTIESVIEYSITYNTNDGVNPLSNPTKYSKGSEIRLLNPEKSGYNGVWKKGNNVISIITSESKGNIILDAEYTLHGYEIKYELNGGKNDKSNPVTYTINNEIKLAAPTKETKTEFVQTKDKYGKLVVNENNTEYKFEGWYTESNTKIDTITEDVLGYKDLTLYAKWSEINTTDLVYMRDDRYIYFGTYPQTLVTDTNIQKKLNASFESLPPSDERGEWISYGYYSGNDKTNSESVKNYMWYIDREYNGEKYRGVYFTSYRPYRTYYSSSISSSYQYDNGYRESEEVYWFKYEQIKWRIINESNGESWLLCDMVIDAMDYNHSEKDHTSGAKGNDWEYSTIRTWLNQTFYNTAFSDCQKSIISVQTLTTEIFKELTKTKVTKDKVFALSLTEAAQVANTKIRTTSYAQCQGAYTIDGYGFWWLRSPENSVSYYVYCVRDSGKVDFCNNYYTGAGVVPSLKIKLKD